MSARWKFCEQCDEPMIMKRSDQKFCSNKCNVRRVRGVPPAKLSEEERNELVQDFMENLRYVYGKRVVLFIHNL
jgi:hypothetical protein